MSALGRTAIVSVALVLAGVLRTAWAAGDDAPLKVRTSAKTGHAAFVAAADGGAIPLPTARGGPAGPLDVLREHGHLFGIRDAAVQLRLAGTRTDALGHTHHTYEQVQRGIRVFGGVVKVHQDARGRWTAANGDFFDVPDKLSTRPVLAAAQAEAIARTVTGQVLAVLERCEPVIVDPGWYGDPPIGPHLAYHVILNDGPAGVREALFVDAHTGAVLDRWDMIHRARTREIHDAGGGTSVPGPLARLEGQGPTGIAEVNRAYDYAGDTYDYFLRAFGRDSIDDLGLPLVVTVRYGGSECPNAYWDGTQMVFCTGLVTDDILAHELTHGVTQYTADLIYQNQPGQLNESFSDVFGDLVDLFNGNAAFAGTPSGPPFWPSHPTGPGTDTPNNLRTSCGNTGSNGYRWLMGEDATGLGAIRDMFAPTCFGDPDRANSPLQTCDPRDGGGVHSGSGVPNHAVAILTDGKTFNGQTVVGIGPIKAGAVWYRALTTYLTVASDFEDAYVAFNAAAADLIGTFPNDPRTGTPSVSQFTAFDAQQVDKALIAVEMNTTGACGDTAAVLNSTPPATCSRRVVYRDDFENGPNGWTVSNTNPPTPYNWVQTAGVLPFGRPGTVWFCDDPDLGDCQAIDESGVHDLTTPPIVLPATGSDFTVAYTHYLAAETGWDGGNVKIKVNFGAWQLIPGSAFSYNPYNATLNTSGQGNTNPLAGQPAWTGAGGRWGTSLISLVGFATSGDTIQVRFEFSKDGCTGLDGWYIDDFEVYTCQPGDFDHDGDVDLSDFGHLQHCLSGQGTPQPDPACSEVRLDGDSDVDQIDLGIFTGCLSGEGILAHPDCAN